MGAFEESEVAAVRGLDRRLRRPHRADRQRGRRLPPARRARPSRSAAPSTRSRATARSRCWWCRCATTRTSSSASSSSSTRSATPRSSCSRSSSSTRAVIPFTSVDEELVTSLASQAAVAFENARLIQDIKDLFDSFVKASVTAIESRDPTTSGHSSRVATLTVGIGEKLDALDERPLPRGALHARPAPGDQVREPPARLRQGRRAREGPHQGQEALRRRDAPHPAALLVHQAHAGGGARARQAGADAVEPGRRPTCSRRWTAPTRPSARRSTRSCA